MITSNIIKIKKMWRRMKGLNKLSLKKMITILMSISLIMKIKLWNNIREFILEITMLILELAGD
jgi:hypothetical protein